MGNNQFFIVDEQQNQRENGNSPTQLYYIIYHSIESSWTNSYYSQYCKLEWVGRLFLLAKWVAFSFKKIT